MAGKESLEKLKRDIEAADATLKQLTQSTSGAAAVVLAMEQHKLRLWVTLLIVAMYVAFVVIYSAMLGYHSVQVEDPTTTWDKLFDFAKVAIIPVLTLVLGYYFGAGARAENK